MATGGRFREMMKKYGKVALGVHFSVSTASIAGLYVAIKNNVDVENLFHKVGLSGLATKNQEPTSGDQETPAPPAPDQNKNRTADLAASSGGALMLAILCNKALFPIRVPITVALTPAVSRFLARRKIINTRV